MSTDQNDVRQAKQSLRKHIRSKLSSLTPEEITSQSKTVWDELYKLPQYQSATSVGLFLSMPKGEIKTDEPCQKVLNDGKDLYVPRVGLDFEQCDMDLIKVPVPEKSNSDNDSDNEKNEIFHKDWPRNKWGIPEAPVDVEYDLAQPGNLDLLIVPGLAFDRDGGRLGQGKGYYDRFITKMSVDEKKRPLLVAVGMEPSFVEEGIPTHEHDRHMDLVILPQLGTLVTNTNSNTN